MDQRRLVAAQTGWGRAAAKVDDSIGSETRSSSDVVADRLAASVLQVRAMAARWLEADDPEAATILDELGDELEAHARRRRLTG